MLLVLSRRALAAALVLRDASTDLHDGADT
jgi:hypothetical protein